MGRSFSKFELELYYLRRNIKKTWEFSEQHSTLSLVSLGVLYPVKQNLEVAISGTFGSETDGFTLDVRRFRGLVQYDTERFGTLRVYGGRQSFGRRESSEFGIGSEFSAFSSSLAGIGIDYQSRNGEYWTNLKAGLETPLSGKLDLRVGTIYRLSEHHEWDEWFSDYSGLDYTMGIGYSLSEKVQIDLCRQWFSQRRESGDYKDDHYNFRASLRVKLG